jgi:hypothetical protein
MCGHKIGSLGLFADYSPFDASLERTSMSGLWNGGIFGQVLNRTVFFHVFDFFNQRFRKVSSCRSKMSPSNFQLDKIAADRSDASF